MKVGDREGGRVSKAINKTGIGGGREGGKNSLLSLSTGQERER